MKKLMTFFVALWVILLLALMPVVSAQEGTLSLGCTTKEISAKALGDHECDDNEWHFVINQIDSEAQAPSSIHVVWANGASEDVSRNAFAGKVGHYTTTSNLDSTVTSATAWIYVDWNGQFNLSHGPCPPPPPCVETKPPEYGEWTPWSEWSACVNGEQSRTRSREVIVYDKYQEDYICDQWTETDTETQWCNLCEETSPPVYGEWSEWSNWSDCVDGWKTRTRTRVVQEVDVNHPEYICKEWVEPDTQKEPCDYCVITELVYGEWTPYGEWTECVNGIRSRTRTRDVWEMDVIHPGYECGHTVEPDTQTESCWPEVCEVIDTHGISYCTDWSECIEGIQTQECTNETWTTDHYRPEIVCGRSSSTTIEERACQEFEDKTPAGQVELIFSCPVLEAYDPLNWDFPNNVPTGESLYDIPGPCGPDECKIHPRGGYWRFAESVSTMLANGRLDPYGEYFALLTCWDVNRGWWPLGLVRPMYYEEDVYPTFPIRWWVEAWADPNQTPSSFNHEWYQVIRPQDFGLVGLN